jgi:type I restriction enzyme S subunit
MKTRDVLHKKLKQKYKEPSKPILMDLPIIDDTWTWATMDQLTTHEPNAITDGPFGSNLKTEHYREAGPRVIRLQNIGDGIFFDEYAHISPEHFEKLNKHCIFSGDVAIAALGDPVPRACIIPPHVGPAIVKADCIRFKPHPDLADCSYVRYALNDQATRRRMTEVVHGVGRARLNLAEIKAISISLPPLVEQEEIVRRVETLLRLADSIEKRVTVATSRANKLTQAILGKAFRGELVPTEAELARREERSYEPASALLARIKAKDQGLLRA